MQIQKFIKVVALMILFFTGCRKFVQVSPPETLLSTEEVFSDDRSATSALAGMYSRAMAFQGAFLNGGNTLYPALSADECSLTLVTAGMQEFVSDALSSGNMYISSFYGSAYNGIYNANMLLENLAHSSAVSAPVRQQIMGEAMFTRALIYSRLVELFGPVPLVTTTNADVNAVMPRSPITDVYRQIEGDLHAADSLLDSSYVAADDGPDRTRPNKWAARALSARVHVYRSEWAAAESDATAVIGSGAYLLEPSLDSVFLKGSLEAIWQLQPVSSVMNSAEGFYFLPLDNVLVKPSYVLTSVLLNAFQPGDLRRTHWVGTKVISGVPYMYPAKYKVRTGPPYKEYDMVIRLAEMYLLRAEARLGQGNLAGAIEDLNSLRSRAGLSSLPGSLSPTDVMTALMQERRIEFFAEWGHRWSDLKRLGLADAVLTPVKTTWSPNDSLYPLPMTDIQRNPALVQNAGY